MKLFEIIDPNMQQNIATGFAKLPKLIQDRLLKHYNISNISLINTIPADRLQDVVHDVQYFTANPNAAQRVYDDTPVDQPSEQPVVNAPKINMTAKQAGHVPGDTQKYPGIGYFNKPQAG